MSEIIYMRTRNPEIAEDWYDFKGDLLIWDKDKRVMHNHDENDIPNDQINVNVSLRHGHIVRIGKL